MKDQQSKSYCLDLKNFRETRTVSGFEVDLNSLDEGQVMLKIDKVAFTANSVSYVVGSMAGFMPWLKMFDAPEGFGQIPCWGYGEVVFSKNEQIEVGRRAYGFFPISTHIICTPGQIRGSGFSDANPKRKDVAPFYNKYVYTESMEGSGSDKISEEHTMLFRPLFGTSFLLENFCRENDFFGADRVIISSASAKTAFGFAALLKKEDIEKEVIGLTSQGNLNFVESTGFYDKVFTYENLKEIPVIGSSIYFDIAGNTRVTSDVLIHLDSNILYAGQVGKTHWDANSVKTTRLEMWSGPEQVMKLTQKYGAREMTMMVEKSMAEFLPSAMRWTKVKNSEGFSEIDSTVQELLSGKIKANIGNILLPA